MKKWIAILAMMLLPTLGMAEDHVFYVPLGGPNWSSLPHDIIPDADNTYDLGSSTKEWKDLYVDGTGYIDALSGETATLTEGGGSTATPNVYADQFVVDKNNETGISILTPNNKYGYLVFGDSDAPEIGGVSYNHSTDTMYLRTGGGNSVSVQNGDIALGTSSVSGNATYHDAGTATFKDDGDDTQVVFGPVADGTTTLGVTGSLDVSGSVDAGTLTVGSGSITDSSGAISFGDENLSTTGTLAGATLNTGQGDNELYAMNQDVETTDSPTFVTAKLSGLTDNYLPKHTNDSTGLENSAIVDSSGSIGISTTAPDKALEVNSATGANMRLTYNDGDGTAIYYTDFSTDGSGNMTIAPVGGVNITKMSVLSKTADYNVTTSDFGKSIRFSHASTTGTMTLPSVAAPHDGARLTFIKTGVARLVIDAADSDLIYDSSAGGTIYADSAYASITLEYVDGITAWVIISAVGIWTTT